MNLNSYSQWGSRERPVKAMNSRDLRIVFFCVRIESRIESAVRFDFESNFRIESAVYTSEYLIHSIGIYFVFVTNESDARDWVLVIHFNSVLKRVKTMPLYDYLTPKLDFKRKFNHRQSFLYKGRLTVQTIRKFRIGSPLRIESRIRSSIRNRIESRSFAGP